MRFLFLILLTSVNAFAILPLPYSMEATEEAVQTDNVEIRPREIQGYEDLYKASQLREMELPKFENGSDVLGYKGPETFAVPPELKERVEFWKKIYSQYTSSQALLHDSEHPEIIYEVIDVSDIMKDTSTSQRQKIRALSKVTKGPKETIQTQLKQLQEMEGNPSSISVELFPLFKKFEGVTEEKRFDKAAKRIRMQIGQRDHVVSGFLYGGRYFNQMMKIFEQAKMPKELTRLTLVESAFNLGARSKVGASGVWQFMRSTGKKFLQINRAVDERNDPLAATWAATQLLRGNFEALGSWPLAITAYNHGREGMQRAVRELSSVDLVDIIHRYKARNFGFASSNFYSEFLAVLEVEREYRKYFGKLMVDSPVQFEEFLVSDNSRFSELSGACTVEKAELAVLNPALTDWVTAGKGYVPKGFTLKVPMGKLQVCKANERNITSLSRTQLQSEGKHHG
jgi:membrane-bound lytic murein transglycosylase D